MFHLDRVPFGSGPSSSAAFLAPFSQERNSHPGDNVT